MKTIIAILSTITLCGCFGYHAELQQEEQAAYNARVACTNLINAVNEAEQHPLTINTNH